MIRWRATVASLPKKSQYRIKRNNELVSRAPTGWVEQVAISVCGCHHHHLSSRSCETKCAVLVRHRCRPHVQIFQPSQDHKRMQTIGINAWRLHKKKCPVRCLEPLQAFASLFHPDCQYACYPIDQTNALRYSVQIAAVTGILRHFCMVDRVPVC